MLSFIPLLRTRLGRIAFITLMVLVIGHRHADAAPPLAQMPQHEQANDQAVWQTVSDSTLDRLRGGFDVGGLLVSFGITRAVYLNGALLTETTLNLGQIGQLSPAQAAQLGGQVAGLNLVKVGPGNTAALEGALQPSAVGGVLPGVVVQNTLNNQNINVQTMINATSNGLGILRGMNATRTLTDPTR